MEKQVKTLLSKKRKHKAKVTVSEPKNMKLDSIAPTEVGKQSAKVQKTALPQVTSEGLTMEEIGERYPVLKDEELVKKFLNVPISNNQKGRIRQVLRDHLKGISESLLPDVIHNRIQAILKNSQNLTDTDLRKLRVLHNMLKTATAAEKSAKLKVEKNKTVVEKKNTAKKKEKVESEEKENVEKEKLEKRVKGPKRYVVFLGNLPLDVDKEKIMTHFSELDDHIKDVRIPNKRSEDKKSGIAYVELSDELSYELALSKHHSMLDNKRINVLYTAQQGSRLSKTTAKGKSAKLIALQKAGKLIGSVPLNRKRSYRRKKMKEALAKQTATAM